MTKFFLTRPIFAAVCSLIVLIAGLIAIPTLPVAQYPQIAPPTVTVNAAYIGASPEAVETSVTIPLEQAINGVQGLRYISSSSAQGGVQITCTFNLGTDLDIAATDVQNAVQSALGRLPSAVIQTGVTVSKSANAFVMGYALQSDSSKYDALYLNNYADLNIVNDLKRIPGVSNVQIFGQRRYAMRIWINPQALAARGLAITDVIAALQEQNVQVAAGTIGGTPQNSDQPYTYTVNAFGRLGDPAQFRNIILRNDPQGGFTRLGDVARIELGAEDYSSYLRFDGNQNATGFGVIQLPSANALSVANAVKARMAELAKSFPPGVHAKIAFNATDFVFESIKDVVITLVVAILLVVLVIFIFLQDARATLIPAATIPISLIGTFFIMKLAGFTINTVTLFGLTLATGLVVDDAIVVIENIARFNSEHKMKGIEGAAAAMAEIQSAIVASSIVLLAVFIPVGFFPGTTGQLYKQFALTISASISISLFAALTLAPVLTAKLLTGDGIESTHGFFGLFNRYNNRFRGWYRATLPKLIRSRGLVVGIFIAALGVTGFLFTSTPTGFIPAEDQGFLIFIVQAPEGSSLAQEHAIAVKAENLIRKTAGVADVFDIGGFSFAGSAPNRGIMFVRLKPWSQRTSFFESPTGILYAGPNALMPKFAKQIPQALVLGFNPPAINGVGSFCCFQFELEDRGNVGLDKLMQTVYGYEALGNKPGGPLTQVFTQFSNNSPQLQLHFNRNRIKAAGINLGDLFTTLQANLGSVYVNDFNYLARSYRVYVQADTPYRDRVASLQNLYVRSAAGGISPVASLVDAKLVQTAPVITHYNLYRSIEIDGSAASGYGTGQAISAMEALAKKLDPAGVSYEWTGLSLDEIQAGAQSTLIFALGIIFVFLILSAQYESFIDPFIVILAVPAALLGALLFMNFRLFMGHAGFPWILLLGNPSLSQDAYAQVGYVMLIGLASKSAILIVEFANQQIKAGADVVTAALRAAQTRLRPILMTSIAFIIAVVPLVAASGAGSGARQSLGTVVFGGMVISTVLNLAITPVLYVIIKGAELQAKKRRAERKAKAIAR